MFTMEDLRQFFDKATMEVDGIIFRLTEDEYMAGELAVWYSEKYKVIATPAFDDVPIAVEVLEVDTNGDHNTIYADGYYGEVNSFEQYTEIVKTLTKKILDDRKNK
mgnify:CR=1 FL=1|jgi:hypothetical protein